MLLKKRTLNTFSVPVLVKKTSGQVKNVSAVFVKVQDNTLASGGLGPNKQVRLEEVKYLLNMRRDFKGVF